MDRVLQVIRERRSVRRSTTTAVDDATADEGIDRRPARLRSRADEHQH